MIVYFLRGVPGCGKSTLASILFENAYAVAFASRQFTDRPCVRCEADDFFMTENGYAFQAASIHRAHEACMDKYKAAVQDKIDTIIVSNTSCEEWTIEPYQKLAEDNGYTFISLIVENRHDGQNIHNVPEQTIERMKRKFHVKL
jgi:hypothetical protein